MKFSIITPSFNRLTYLDDTINSVLTQAGDFEIEYIIQDGGSGPELISILQKWEDDISSGNFKPRCNKITFQWFSEKDNGMYDAINKGFSKATGDIMAWINTDDLYHPGAFSAASRIFLKFQNVGWITGIPNSFNKNGTTVGYDTFPAAYSKEFIKRGFYNVKFVEYGFNWIPQDCVFWRSSLWEKTGKSVDDTKMLAGDFYLWQKFAEHTDLVKVNAFLGGYRFHGDQFTATTDDYQKELPEVLNLPFGYKRLYKLLSSFPSLRKLIFNKRKGFPFISILGLKWGWIVGTIVRWNHQKQDWILENKAII